MTLTRRPTAPRLNRKELRGAVSLEQRKRLLVTTGFLLPLIPSPALVILAAPLLLGICAALFLTGSQIGSSTEVVSKRLQPASRIVVLALALMLGTIVADPSTTGALRLAARMLFLLFVVAFVTNLRGIERSTRDRVLRSFLYGTGVVCGVAIASSLLKIPIAGELRPSRGIGLLPSGWKSAGVVRSYGEAALIYSGALSILYHQRDRIRPSVRLGLFVLLILGVSVSHSRNVYATAAFTLILLLAHFLGSSRSRSSWSALLRVSLLLAFLTPFLVGVVAGAASTSPIARYFVGEGTTQSSVDSRVNHARTAVDLIINDPTVLATGATEVEWFAASGEDVAPHNQFVSLLIFNTPLFGAVAIAILYLGPVWGAARELPFVDAPLAIWGAGVVYALSSYEGLFSPSLALCVAVLIATRQDIRSHAATSSWVQPK